MSEFGEADEGGFSLAGRTVVVTGAGRGLGRAVALAAAAAGARVVGVARSTGQLDGVAEAAADLPGSVEPLPWDLSELDRLDDLATAVSGAVHGVVHVAGVQLRKPSHELTVAEWRMVLDVNLAAPFLLSTALFRHRFTEGASHVFVGSLTSRIGIGGLAPYGAAKSGLMGVVRTLAVEWAPRGVRVNALNPGYFRTELTEPVFADPVRRDWVLSRIPMGRTGEPAELGGTAVYLLADASRYVTGQQIGVDGGWLAG